MRTGEVLALRFGDVDLLNQKIHVERSLSRGVLSNTTRHSFASIMLSEGQPPAWVANMMGDNLETVLRNYAQWIPTDYKTNLMRPINTGLDGHFLDTPEGAEQPQIFEIPHFLV